MLDQNTPPEEIAVEMFSKADQYTALVRLDRAVDVVEAPVPDEPDEEAVVIVDGIAYQRLTHRWWRVGRPEPLTWVELCRLGEPTVVDAGP